MTGINHACRLCINVLKWAINATKSYSEIEYGGMFVPKMLLTGGGEVTILFQFNLVAIVFVNFPGCLASYFWGRGIVKLLYIFAGNSFLLLTRDLPLLPWNSSIHLISTVNYASSFLVSWALAGQQVWWIKVELLPKLVQRSLQGSIGLLTLVRSWC